MGDESDDELLAFHEMGLDDRILKSIAKLGWSQPTLIQERAIPLALEGKDVLARARTGSGKTAAYAIPVIQKIIDSKQVATEQCVKALVLTPTRELCSQAYANIKALTSSCSREVRCVDISGQMTLDAQRPLLMENPDIVVGTPSRVLAHLQAKNLSLKDSLEMVVIDEADLVFSFGYEDDVKVLLGHFPKIYQAFLMSATLSEDVKALRKMVLHNPVILKLEEPQLPEPAQLTQYHIKCDKDDKFLIIYALLKLKLIRGKSLIFVNTVNKCYKLKLFLEQFAIKSCVLNSELPVNSRCHIVQQFNDGLYDYIIAADEVVIQEHSSSQMQTDVKPKKQKRKKDKESGVSRGIDFQNISNVINFDFPPDTDSYIHRVGRTARGSAKGTALSFVTDDEMTHLEAVKTKLTESHPEGDEIFKPYNFRMSEIEAFRYRAGDALRSVTQKSIKDARMKEIKTEIFNSQKLKAYFDDNPRDQQLLRHDKGSHTIKVQPQLKNVPDYLVPPSLRRWHTGPGKFKSKAGASDEHKKKPYRGPRRPNKRKMDPLKTFEFSGLTTKKKKKE